MTEPQYEVYFSIYMEWLNTSRDQFDFLQETDPSEQLLLLKPFAEFVLITDVIMSYCPQYKQGHDHLAWAWDKIEQGDLLLRILLVRPDLRQLAGIYACLHHWGYQNIRLLQLLDKIGSMRTVVGMELLPWVRLSIERAYCRLGLAEREVHLNQSWVSNLPEPWTITNDNAYALTHWIFYLTSFGLEYYNFDAELLQYLQLWLPVWVKYFELKDNNDLVAELIMVSDCIGGIEWVSDPLLRLLARTEQDGFVTGPKGAGYQMIRPTQTEERSRFLSNYHTTLVAIAALCIRMHKSNLTPVSILLANSIDDLNQGKN